MAGALASARSERARDSAIAGDPIPQFKTPVAANRPETVGGPGPTATSGNTTAGVGFGPEDKSVNLGGSIKFSDEDGALCGLDP